MKRFTLLALACAALFAVPAYATDPQPDPGGSALTSAFGASQSGTKLSLEDLKAIAELVRGPAVSPAPAAPSAAVRMLAPASVALAVDAGTVAPIPDPTVDPMGFVRMVSQVIADHRWWALLPLLLVAAIFLVRKFGASKWPWLSSPQAGSIASLCAVVGGAYFVAISAGLSGFLPITLAALALLSAGYPLFKTLGNLGDAKPKALIQPPAVPAPKAPSAEELAAAAAKVETAAAAKGKTATELDAELRSPVQP